MQVLTVMFPQHADLLIFKVINLVRFTRLVKIKRKLAAYLVSPWTHLASVLVVYMISAHCLACLLFFVGRWQLLNLENGGPNDFVGELPNAFCTLSPQCCRLRATLSHGTGVQEIRGWRTSAYSLQTRRRSTV